MRTKRLPSLQRYFPGDSATYPGLPVHTFKEASVNYHLGGWENQHYALKFHFHPLCTVSKSDTIVSVRFRANGSNQVRKQLQNCSSSLASAGRVAARVEKASKALKA